MTTAAIILGLSIVVSALTKLIYTVRPRRMMCQLTVMGPTVQGDETFHLTTSLFEDESEEVWQQKINTVCKIRERRVAYQNRIMQEVQDRAKEILEEESKEQGKKVTSFKDVKNPKRLEALQSLGT